MQKSHSVGHVSDQEKVTLNSLVFHHRGLKHIEAFCHLILEKSDTAIVGEFKNFKLKIDNYLKEGSLKTKHVNLILLKISNFICSKEIYLYPEKFLICVPIIEEVCNITELSNSKPAQDILKKTKTLQAKFLKERELLLGQKKNEDLKYLDSILSLPTKQLEDKFNSIKLTLETCIKDGKSKIDSINELLRKIELFVESKSVYLSIEKFQICTPIIEHIYKFPDLKKLGIDTDAAFNKLADRIAEFKTKQLLEKKYAFEIIQAMWDPTKLEPNCSDFVKDLIKKIREETLPAKKKKSLKQ